MKTIQENKPFRIVVFIAVGLIAFAAGLTARQPQVIALKEALLNKTEQLVEIIKQSETETEEIELQAENIVEESKNEIIKISADELFDMLATDDEHNSKAAYLDGIFIEQVRHLENILGEVGVFLATEK